MDKKSVWAVLSAIDCNSKVEKKNGLTYLSWAWAWAELKNHFPEATYTLYENEHGWNYFPDGQNCWVKTRVTVDGIEHIEYLPVMDFKNKSISAEQVTSFDVNKTIQRSMTKAIARHGLGNYIYAGEDLPEQATSAPAIAEPDAEKPKLVKGTENWDRVVTYVKANRVMGVTAIGKQLSRKYEISGPLKKEIQKLIEADGD